MAANPGANVFITTNYLNYVKNSFWPKVEDAISNLHIGEVAHFSKFLQDITVNDLKVQVGLGRGDVFIEIDNGKIILMAREVLVNADAHWILGNFAYELNGGLNAKGILNFVTVLNIGTQNGKDGLIPKVNFERFSFGNTGFSISVTNNTLAPFLNKLTPLIQGVISDALQNN